MDRTINMSTKPFSLLVNPDISIFLMPYVTKEDYELTEIIIPVLKDCLDN